MMIVTSENPHRRFGRLCHYVPELGRLLVEASTVQDDGERFCANRVWYKRFKPRLCELVGWTAGRVYKKSPPKIYTLAQLLDEVGAEPPRPEPTYSIEFTDEEAYDLAYETIYHALPDCRECACPGVG